jgi:hypothetical protein
VSATDGVLPALERSCLRPAVLGVKKRTFMGIRARPGLSGKTGSSGRLVATRKLCLLPVRDVRREYDKPLNPTK